MISEYRKNISYQSAASPAQKTMRLMAHLFKFFSFSLLVAALAGAAFASWFNQSYSADLHAVLNHKAPVVTLLDDQGVELAKRGIRRAFVPINELPQSLIDAVVSTEDRRFFSHYGVDPVGLARAILRNMGSSRRMEGGSTITQQLVKNVFLSHKRTLLRKFRELVISFWLEAHYSKQQILEFYLNRVYFGAGASNGIEAASHRYFDKSARDLSMAESALMAGLLKAPSWYSPLKSLPRSHRRASVVLANMVATGAISDDLAREVRTNPAQVHRPAVKTRHYNGTEYAIDWIMEQLKRRVGTIETDLVVKTTLSTKWQVQAQKIVAQMINKASGAQNVDQAAAVLLDARGGVKLMIGGTSYKKSQFNRVTRARRQPGSSFKPIVFLAALEQGFTPASTIIDGPIRVDRWRPHNYSHHYQGRVTLRRAMAKSINTVAVKLAQKIGVSKIIRTAHRLGITGKLSSRPSLALGASEVTPLELTSAYVPLMNGGLNASTHIISKVSGADGELIYEHDNHTYRIIKRRHVRQMNNMLGAVIRTGTGKRAKLAGHQVAGKTGTSQNYRDAWFMGYSGHYACGIWAGNDDGHPTNGVSGGKLPARIWKQIMRMAHKGKKPRPLPGLNGYGRGRAVPQALIIAPRPPQNNIIINSSSLAPALQPMTVIKGKG